MPPKFNNPIIGSTPPEKANWKVTYIHSKGGTRCAYYHNTNIAAVHYRMSARKTVVEILSIEEFSAAASEDSKQAQVSAA